MDGRYNHGITSLLLDRYRILRNKPISGRSCAHLHDSS